MNRYTVTVMSDRQPRKFLVNNTQLGDLVQTVVFGEMATFEVSVGWNMPRVEDTVIRVKVGEHWEHHCQTHAAHAAAIIEFLSQHPFASDVDMVAISQYGMGHVIASNRSEHLAVAGYYLAPAPIPA